MEMKLEGDIITSSVYYLPGRIRQDDFKVVASVDDLAPGVGGVRVGEQIGTAGRA